MADPIDWGVTSWEGHRRRQHEDFRALPLRDKLLIVEEMGEVASFFAQRRQARGLPTRSNPPSSGGSTPNSADPGRP